MTPDKLLVLDLDETLIYATETPLARAPDFRAGRYHVYKRPNLTPFLNTCFAHFTVAVWTSASPAFAARVIEDCFPPSSELAFVWASDRCTWVRDVESGTLYARKPLTKLTRRGWPKQTIIAVDDTPQKWEHSYGNLVAVRPFYGDLDDDELMPLASYLLTLKGVPNVRTLEKRGWRHGT